MQSFSPKHRKKMKMPEVTFPSPTIQSSFWFFRSILILMRAWSRIHSYKLIQQMAPLPIWPLSISQSGGAIWWIIVHFLDRIRTPPDNNYCVVFPSLLVLHVCFVQVRSMVLNDRPNTHRLWSNHELKSHRLGAGKGLVSTWNCY